MILPRAIPTEFYGDQTRWFTALVIDARPPEGKGLEGYVRIRIHGVHSPSLKDIPEADLPWAQVLIPTTEGGTSGLGATPRIEAGALVIGLFMDGRMSQVPVVLGSLPVTTFKTPIQLGYDPITEDTAGTDDAVAEINLENVENENTGAITEDIREARQEELIKDMLRNGYDVEKAISVTARADIRSGMVTGEGQEGFGIDNFAGERLEQLKQFSPEFQNYDTQVKFLAHELNTTRAQDRVTMGNSLNKQAETLGATATETAAIKKKQLALYDIHGGG